MTGPRQIIGFILMLLASLVAVVTRIPAETLFIAFGTIAAALTITVASIIALASKRRGAMIATALATIILLVLPTHREAFLVLPGWIVPTVALLGLLLLGRDHEASAPVIGDEATEHTRRVLRIAITTTLVVTATILIVPLLSWLLPDRWASLAELDGVPGPLLGGLVISTPILLFVWLRSLMPPQKIPLAPEVPHQ